MKKLFLALTLSCAAAQAMDSTAVVSASPRERILFDEGWKFALGNAADSAKDFQYLYGMTLSKTGFGGCAFGAILQDFNDSAWRTIDLPHDWAVELPFTTDPKYHQQVPWRVMDHGFKPVGPYFPETSIGWYRKTFDIPKSDEGRRVSIVFDGSYRDTEVWLNHYRIGRHEGGYAGFRFDLTDYLNYGGKNVLSIRVDATKYEGWFYEGAGIYRHVWLEKTNPLHIAPSGVRVVTKLAPDLKSAEVSADVTIVNDGPATNATTMALTILDPAGKTVGGATGTAAVRIANAQLWSLESPQLYRMIVELKSGDNVADRVETTFGLRTIKFDPDQGLLLNGRRVQVNGACNHQDAAGVGVAVPDAVLEWRLQQLKKWGFNAYRTSHNCPAPELADLCDKLGILILDENRSIGSSEDVLRDLRYLVERDRNHPSVIAWSLGNEEGVQSSPQAARFGAVMKKLVYELDGTRPVTYGSNGGTNTSGVMSQLDLFGINYTRLGDFDGLHRQYPHWPMWATEEASTFCTRGIYAEDGGRGYMSAYDVSAAFWGKTAEDWVQHFSARPWLAGAFVWTGFDYRGEPMPYSWPCISSHFGVLDTCGFPKDNAWYYKACWTTEPVLHIFPHWNWPGREGQDIAVWCYSNHEEVELFLNGQSLGRKPVPKLSRVAWTVKYAPGKLTAKAYRQGKLVQTTEVATTGTPAKLMVEVSRTALAAGGRDCAVINVAVCDAQGRVVPTANVPVSFRVSPNARILGVGNGDPSCHEPDVYLSPAASTLTRPLQWLDVATGKNISTDKLQITNENTAADFRAECNLSETELATIETATLRIPSIDDEGTITVNGAAAGKSTNFLVPFVTDIAKLLKVGRNVVAVHVFNKGGQGGITGATGIDVTSRMDAPWHRSAFNGWCQVIVASPKKPGAVTLNITSSGLEPVEVKLQGN